MQIDEVKANNLGSCWLLHRSTLLFYVVIFCHDCVQKKKPGTYTVDLFPPALLTLNINAQILFLFYLAYIEQKHTNHMFLSVIKGSVAQLLCCY
jgi:hypothetical protein